MNAAIICNATLCTTLLHSCNDVIMGLTGHHPQCHNSRLRRHLTQIQPSGYTFGTTTRPDALTSLDVSCFSKNTLAPISSKAFNIASALASLSLMAAVLANPSLSDLSADGQCSLHSHKIWAVSVGINRGTILPLTLDMAPQAALESP